MSDVSINDENKILRSGFTTGSAATAAAKASLIMLLTNNIIDRTEIITPSGEAYSPKIFGQEINISDSNNLYSEQNYASCYVVKDSGDDPDITSGIKIYVKVSFSKEAIVNIRGGKGIGIVTRKGLDQPVGEYAINSTPRKMITDSLCDILDEYDIECGIDVEISVPEGEEIAKKTFNPHMGIEGGISIIGTSGIVKPMSTDALISTIRLDINMQYSEGKDTCIIVPGNYGVTFLKNNYEIDEKDIVICSNFVGDSIKFATEIGFKNITFCSHIGKMIKVSGGAMNTHSKYGDNRMKYMNDAFYSAFSKMNVNENEKTYNDIAARISECVSTTAALDILSEIKMVKAVSEEIVEKTLVHLREVSEDKVNIKVILYENNYGELARSF